MNAKDQLKVIKAGFTIIRKEGEATFSGKKIKYKNKYHPDWMTLHSDFPSNTAMQKKVKELLAIQTIIED